MLESLHSVALYIINFEFLSVFSPFRHKNVLKKFRVFFVVVDAVR